MKAWLEEIKACQDPREAEIMTGLEEVKATDLEANPKEIEVMAEHQEVINEEVAMETIIALEHRYGDRRFAIISRLQLKKWTQGRGVSRLKLAAARGLLTHHAFPAVLRGRHRGPGKTKQRHRRVKLKVHELCLGSRDTFCEALG
jgi:protein-disulfide isomerase-like protein with CxxC motif